MSILNSLYQDKTWGKGDEAIPINMMTTKHIKNVVSWIWRNAASLKLQAEAEMAFGGPKLSGDGATDAFEQAFVELLEQSPRQWFGDLPVVRAFRDELRVGDLNDPTTVWLTRMIGDAEPTIEASNPPAKEIS